MCENLLERAKFLAIKYIMHRKELDRANLRRMYRDNIEELYAETIILSMSNLEIFEELNVTKVYLSYIILLVAS